MTTDPVIEELQRVREELAAKFNSDLHAMFAYWRAREAESGRKVVSFERPKTATKVEGRRTRLGGLNPHQVSFCARSVDNLAFH